MFGSVLGRGAVPGSGSLVRMTKRREEGPSASTVNIGNWGQGSEAFAQAFGKFFELMRAREAPGRRGSQPTPPRKADAEVPRTGPLPLSYARAKKHVQLVRDWTDIQRQNAGKPRREQIRQDEFLSGRKETPQDLKAALSWYGKWRKKGEFPADPRRLDDKTLRRLFRP